MKSGATIFYFSPTSKRELKIKKDKNSLKKNGYYEEIIYNTETSINKFAKKVKSGDTLELHGDGIPWITGGTHFNENVDLNPFSLADLINKNFTDKNIALTIDLRFCTSGVWARGPQGNFCFAQDLSKALYLHGFRNMTVYGYTGYINAERGFKESVSEAGDGSIHGSKIKHCKLEDGRLIYQHDGELVADAKKTLVKTFPYDETDIEKDKTLRDYLDTKLARFSPSAPGCVISEISSISNVESDEDENESEFEQYFSQKNEQAFTPGYTGITSVKIGVDEAANQGVTPSSSPAQVQNLQPH